MSLESSNLSLPSYLSIANRVAVQLENHFRGSDIDSAALSEWTISRMTVNYSDRPIPSRSCTHHEYLIIDASNRRDDQLRLRLDHTGCSAQLSTDDVDRITNLLAAQGLLRRPLESPETSDRVPPNTPTSWCASTSVSSALSGFPDVCIRQICFPISSTSGQIFDIEDRDIGSITSVSGINDAPDFTLFDLVQLVSSVSVQKRLFQERNLAPICNSFAIAITETLRQREYPVIENNSVLIDDEGEPVGDVLEVLSIPREFPRSGSSDQRVNDIEHECLITERSILALKLRLSMADVALSGADVKLFNLQHPAHKIDLAEDRAESSR